MVNEEITGIQKEMASMPNVSNFFRLKSGLGQAILNTGGLALEKKPLFSAFNENHFIPRIVCSDT
jgi:hypothetical protein